jgi:hypothetical protein
MRGLEHRLGSGLNLRAIPMRHSLTLRAAVIALTLLTPSTLFGWGQEGHEIVASLAQTRLTKNAKNGIRSLIGDASLASIANWADEVRPDRDETYNWHFVDIPKDASGFSDERDCFLPSSRHKDAASDHQNCVVDRIELFQKVLSDSNVPRDERIEALKFLVHFVGDVHQPMHAIGEAAGGNRIAVTEFGSTQCGRHPCNLHGAWDTGLIEHTGMARDAYVAGSKEPDSQPNRDEIKGVRPMSSAVRDASDFHEVSRAVGPKPK